MLSGKLIPPFDHCIICSSSIYASDYPFKLSSLICVFCNLLHILTLDNRIVGEGYWENRNQLTYSELQSKCESVQLSIFYLYMYCLLELQLSKWRVGIPFTGLTRTHFYACPNQGPVFTKTYVVDFPFCI